MATYSLNAVEEERAKEFVEYIRKEFGERHLRKSDFEFIMSSTGVGIHVKMRERVSREERDITDYGSW